MPTCGYICPKCGGSQQDQEGNTCDWCSPLNTEDSAAIDKEYKDEESSDN